MSFTKLSPPVSVGVQSRSNSAPVRPQFNSHVTSDRLRESSVLRSPPFKMSGNIRKGRRSIFKELGLDDEYNNESPSNESAPPDFGEVSYTTHGNEKSFGEITGLKSDAKSDQQEDEEEENEDSKEYELSQSDKPLQRQDSSASKPWYTKLAGSKNRPRIRSTSSAPPGTISGLQRFTLIAMLIAIVLPTFTWCKGRSTVGPNGAEAGVVVKREVSPTEVCTRWAHQAALLNGTLYMYGGRAKSEADQTENTWNNNFLTLDLNKDWKTNAPALKGLTKPDGPPEVAMGYLWHDYHNLYLYGGQFSDSPYVDPGPESVWKYSIKDSKWTEFSDPKTSAGNYSEDSNQAVHRAAEGAGISVPELGMSWYFGGHLDWATTPGWSRQVDRVYLKSLLEFTHPGYVNSGVNSLSTGTGAGEQGAFRNITTGGVQADEFPERADEFPERADEFPERADGVLVYVPGWGELGVLIGLAGGTNDSFTHDLGSLDVYDIANSKWFHQETSGDIPSVRVNLCAAVASAPDASSFQIYMFGGQNLQPYGDQEQYDDMYVLTIPSFTWLKVPKSDKTPAARAGHTCTMYDGQIIVVGGYVGKDIACDPGFHVFDASKLEWKDDFSAGDHDADAHADNFVLAGSYGYSVPDAVQQVIGGDQEGSATVTQPAVGPATGGPFLTGKAPVFTVTQAGATATATSAPSSDGSGNSDAHPRLIAAGVIAGVLGALALYLGYCAYLYRRQVRAYKRHLAIANRYSGASTTSLVPPPSSSRHSHGTATNDNSNESFGWVGHGSSGGGGGGPSEPRWNSEGKVSEDTRPGTSRSSGSTEGLLDGQEPSFFSVVLGPRRALRVVNGVEQAE